LVSVHLSSLNLSQIVKFLAQKQMSTKITKIMLFQTCGLIETWCFITNKLITDHFVIYLRAHKRTVEKAKLHTQSRTHSIFQARKW